MPSVDSDRRRQLPAVDRVLADPRLVPVQSLYGTEAVATQVRAELAELRQGLADRRIGEEELATRLARWPELLERRLEERFGAPLRRVLNGTGIFLHTNLGRAPLPLEVARRLAGLATAACDLELDLATGRRGDRSGRLEKLLAALTGAEAARVTNNSAAALLLALAALAGDREVVVSRGELVEIGGSFRIPEILAAAGARIVEVGTTNRTRLADYERAIGPATALLLKVHASNFRISGFVATVEAPALADLAHRRGLLLVADEGAGLLRPPDASPGAATPTRPASLAGHPSMAELLAAGCDLVVGSGDKLLGGPQAGLLVGRQEPVERCSRHPIYRAVRPGRLVTSALDGVLRLHLAGGPLPIDRLWAPPERLEARLLPLASRLNAEILPAPAFVGGGAAPEIAIPGRALAWPADDRFAERLRLGGDGLPPVLGALRDGRFWLDLRTVDPADDETLACAVERALRSDPGVG